MARGVNKVILIGNLGADPEVKYMPSGDCVVNFSLATTETYKNRDGEKVEATEWHKCVAFRRLAEIIGEYCRKGSSLYCEGKIKTRSYEKDGEKRYITEIEVREMQMLGGKGDSAPDHGSGVTPGRANQKQRNEYADAKGGDYPDDIPF